MHWCINVISHSETETKLLTEQSVFTEKISLSLQFSKMLKLKLQFQKHLKVNKKYTLLSLCFKLKWKTGIGYNKKVSNGIDLALQQVWCNSKLISCDKLQVWIGITSIAVFGKKRPCDQKCAITILIRILEQLDLKYCFQIHLYTF